MKWRCKACGKEGDFEPTPSSNPDVFAEALDILLEAQREHQKVSPDCPEEHLSVFDDDDPWCAAVMVQRK